MILSGIIWAWLHGQLHEQHALLSVLGLSSLCSFALAAVSAARGTLSRLIPLFAGSFAAYFDDNTIVPYRQPKLLYKNKMVPYQLPLRLTLRNMAVRLLRNTHENSDSSQRRYRCSTNMDVFTVRCTNTYIHTVRHCLRSTC